MSGILYDFDFQYFVSQQSVSVKVFLNDWLILFHEIWLLTKSRLVYNNLGHVFVIFTMISISYDNWGFENMATDCNHCNDG